jgi:WD40 repeat protein
MGGLIVKQAYLLGCREPEFASVTQRVCSIFFLATPHQGATIAQVLSRLTTMIGARPFVEDLFPQSRMIQALSEDFPHVSGNLQLFSFYETRPMTIGLNKMLIVEKSSAVMNLPNERRTFLDADHRNVAMYSTREDPSYVSVRNALANVIAFQRNLGQSETQAQVAAVSEADRAALARFLGVSAAPEDDLMKQNATKIPGSCEWLASKECYQSWKSPASPSFLWLQGRPGVGKSILSSHVVGELRNDGRDCCFFFFQARDSARSTVDHCLRSMAWQMASLHPPLLDRLKPIMSEWKDNSMGGNTESQSHSVWQKVFLSGILQVRLGTPHFWVIDAIDECKSPGDMVVFLTRIQEHWPLSVLVTSRDSAQTHQQGPNPRVSIQTYSISEQDSLQDISLLLEANLPYLPCPGSDKWPTPEKLASDILGMSAGCFLWASLTCLELRHVTSEREIAEVLNSTPSDMGAVYDDILARMETTRFGKPAIKAILAWATYAFRPLHLAEMQAGIEADIDDKISDVQRIILKSCGSLLFIDQHDKVQLVHLTAREYLTQSDAALAKSELVLTKDNGHRRLALACLKTLLQAAQKPKSRARKVGSDSNRSPLTDYASNFLFQHVHHANSDDEELPLKLLEFLGSNGFLPWIEFIATNGTLRTVYEAGRAIKSLLNRRAQNPPPPINQNSRLSQEKVDLLERWGNDLIHLVPQFSERLRRLPKAIYNHIIPFCPRESAIRQQFASPMRGISVQGLSSRHWEDSVATLRYARDESPCVVATTPGYIAVAVTSQGQGRVVVHDDAIFQEMYTIEHGESVGRLAFAVNGEYLASAGGETVRVWSTRNGLDLGSFKLPKDARCAAMAFADDDAILRVATGRNQLLEWDIESSTLVDDEPISWAPDLPARIGGRLPTGVWLSPGTNLLAALYQGHDIIFWDCTERRFYDIYEQDTGSVQIFGSHCRARGWPTVRAAVFSQAVGTNLFAATFDDGDLVVFDLVSGRPIVVNTERSYSLQLASSPDGRTLVSADKMGHLTLFEFRTLRLLYRVRLETVIFPYDLAFTSDNLRVIELREGQCRVWEPSVLRTGVPDPEPKPISPQDVENDWKTRDQQKVVAMTCSHDFSVLFYAMGNGSVFGYDISGPEPDKTLLFVQETSRSLSALHFDHQGKILACSDHGARFTARKVNKVLRRRENTEQFDPVWDVESPLIDVQPPGGLGIGLVEQILVSSRHERVLLSGKKGDTLWALPTAGGGDWICQTKTGRMRHGHRWMNCPCTRLSADLLLSIDETGQVINVHDWVTLGLLRTVPISPGAGLLLDQFAPLCHPFYYAAFAVEESAQPKTIYDTVPTASILFWDFQDLEGAGSQPVVPRWEIRPSTLPCRVVHLIGAFGTRLVFYTADHWIASFELMPPDSPRGAIVAEGSFMRHFFLPNHWIGSTKVDDMRFQMCSEGEIVFERQGELAVIKRGLEITEDGAAFKPRQLSNKTRAELGGFVSLRQPGISSEFWLETQE